MSSGPGTLCGLRGLEFSKRFFIKIVGQIAGIQMLGLCLNVRKHVSLLTQEVRHSPNYNQKGLLFLSVWWLFLGVFWEDVGHGI